MQSAGFEVWYPDGDACGARVRRGARKPARAAAYSSRLAGTGCLPTRPTCSSESMRPISISTSRIALRSRGITTVHYVSPSIWAWRGERIHKIKRAVIKDAVPVPVRGGDLRARPACRSTYVGHPLADELPEYPDKDAAREQMRLSGDTDRDRVASRQPTERGGHNGRVVHPRPPSWSRAVPECAFSGAAGEPRDPRAFSRRRFTTSRPKTFRHHSVRPRAHGDDRGRCGAGGIGHRHTGSGVAQAPDGDHLQDASPVRVDHARRLSTALVSLPNILAGEFVVPEILQDDATPENLAQALVNQIARQGSPQAAGAAVSGDSPDRSGRKCGDARSRQSCRCWRRTDRPARCRAIAAAPGRGARVTRGDAPASAAWMRRVAARWPDRYSLLAWCCDPTRPISGLADSKKLSPSRREELAMQIRCRAAAWAIASASVQEIDTHNILQASLLAMRRAVEQLAVEPHQVLVDGLHCPQCVFRSGRWCVATTRSPQFRPHPFSPRPRAMRSWSSCTRAIPTTASIDTRAIPPPITSPHCSAAACLPCTGAASRPCAYCSSAATA